MLDSAQVENVLKELDQKEDFSRKNIFAKIPKYIRLFVAVLLVIILATVAYFLLSQFWKNKLIKKEANIWTPPIQEAPAILGGTQSYTISGGTKGLPQITNLTLNPQDPKQGKDQTISISANNGTLIKEVVAVLHLDNNKDFEYILDLKEGTNTNGTWVKTISFPGTYNNAYRVTVKARNENNLGNMSTISIR